MVSSQAARARPSTRMGFTSWWRTGAFLRPRGGHAHAVGSHRAFRPHGARRGRAGNGFTLAASPPAFSSLLPFVLYTYSNAASIASSPPSLGWGSTVGQV
jgi:hypothetical protein